MNSRLMRRIAAIISAFPAEIISCLALARPSSKRTLAVIQTLRVRQLMCRNGFDDRTDGT